MRKRLLSLFLLLCLAGNSYAQRGYLKQSTATTVEIHLVNASTGAGITGATVTSITAFVRKHSDSSSSTKTDLTVTASGGSNDAVEVGLGDYNLELTTGNTDTLGKFTLCYSYTAAVTQCDSYTVVSANNYDALITAASSIDDFWEYAKASITGTTSIGYWLKTNSDVPTSYLGVTRTATAQAGAATSITLDTGAEAVDDYYNFKRIIIVSGTGSGQSAIISDYVGSTRVATTFCEGTTTGSWRTNPASDSVFVIQPRNRQ